MRSLAPAVLFHKQPGGRLWATGRTAVGNRANGDLDWQRMFRIRKADPACQLGKNKQMQVDGRTAALPIRRVGMAAMRHETRRMAAIVCGSSWSMPTHERRSPFSMLTTMPPVTAKDTDPLSELDRRHDDALRQLDELDQEIERALNAFSAVQKETAERFGRTQKAAA